MQRNDPNLCSTSHVYQPVSCLQLEIPYAAKHSISIWFGQTIPSFQEVFIDLGIHYISLHLIKHLNTGGVSLVTDELKSAHRK
jgi:hypothetical protein